LFIIIVVTIFCTFLLLFCFYDVFTMFLPYCYYYVWLLTDKHQAQLNLESLQTTNKLLSQKLEQTMTIIGQNQEQLKKADEKMKEIGDTYNNLRSSMKSEVDSFGQFFQKIVMEKGVSTRLARPELENDINNVLNTFTTREQYLSMINLVSNWFAKS
jgi:hypothetical protein